MHENPTILWLSVGSIRNLALTTGWVKSAIVKEPGQGPRRLTAAGLEGDSQADLRVHGGPDKAVCVYPVEHYASWRERLGATLAPVAFGENFTTIGVLEAGVCIGDTYRVGDALVQVSQPRTPCFRLAALHGQPNMPKWVIATGRTGFYFRTLEPGTVEPGMALTLVDRPSPGITVLGAHLAAYASSPSRSNILRVIHAEGLAAAWREALRRRLERAGRSVA